MSNRNSFIRAMLLYLFMCSPSLLAAQEFDLMSEMGTLYGHAIDCGEPAEALAPYVEYLIYLSGAHMRAKTKAEFLQLYSEGMSDFQDALKAAKEGPPVSNCAAIFRDLDKIKQVTHDFYDSLSPSFREDFNLSPLPPIQ